jgi:hypothetical protein
MIAVSPRFRDDHTVEATGSYGLLKQLGLVRMQSMLRSEKGFKGVVICSLGAKQKLARDLLAARVI